MELLGLGAFWLFRGILTVSFVPGAEVAKFVLHESLRNRSYHLKASYYGHNYLHRR